MNATSPNPTALWKLKPRRNGTKSILSGTVTYNSDVTTNPESYFVRFHFFFSTRMLLINFGLQLNQVQADFSVDPFGNNMYTKTPMRFPRQDYCSFLDVTYRRYFMGTFKPPATDLMYTEDPKEKLCDIFKRNGPVRADLLELPLFIDSLKISTICIDNIQNQFCINRPRCSSISFHSRTVQIGFICFQGR